MKPENTRPAFKLPDNEPVRCRFMARADAPVFWERCETDATEELPLGDYIAFNRWVERHPNHIIRLEPGRGFVCDTHLRVIRQTIGPVEGEA